MARYIDAEELKSVIQANDWSNPAVPNVVNMIVDRIPTEDVVPVVRCKDCKYCIDEGMSGLWCNHADNRNPIGCRPDDYCNDGERKDYESNMP